MDKYIEFEKRLAELLGYSSGLRIKVLVTDEEVGPLYCDGKVLPMWCRDDAAAFRLLVEYKVEINPDDISTKYHSVKYTVYAGDDLAEGLVAYADHPDEATAVRYAIVMAVIAKLEAEHGR